MPSTNIDEKQFWLGIIILINNFHAVFSKINSFSIKNIKKVKVSNDDHQLTVENDDVTVEQLIETIKNFEFKNNTQFVGFDFSIYLQHKKLNTTIVALARLRFCNNLFNCSFLSSNLFEDFSIELLNAHVLVKILTKRLDATTRQRSSHVLEYKFLKWCSSNCGTQHINSTKSLQLIDTQFYYDLYRDFKEKYAIEALKYWHDAQESTDPLKFIYEDLAIAAYLIALWRKHNVVPQAFADLGCGNGLLVHILNSAGYKGYGYDIRSRKIWNYYPSAIQQKLFERSIDPLEPNLPNDVDWLIGNHSDELSPWLPILAANTSYKMCYFLLPCCAYEFSGVKYQRRNSSMSVYQDFLNYAEAVSQKCGFTTYRDRLKIPSTKRIALVGLTRTYAAIEHITHKEMIENFVKQSIVLSGELLSVKLREKYEPVRNCTQIEKSVLDDLIAKIFEQLLATAEDKMHDQISSSWQVGGRLSIRDIAGHLSKEDLQQIKSECGGLKTLLKNKHEVFEFCGNDLIGVRKPQVRNSNSKKSQTVKKRLCFFKQHHPNGCPLTDEQCTFVH